MQNSQSSGNYIAIGYIFAAISAFVLPIIFTPLAMIVGCINMYKREEVHGLFQIILGFALGLLSSSLGGPGFGLPNYISSRIKPYYFQFRISSPNNMGLFFC